MNRTFRWSAGLVAVLALCGADCRPWSPVSRLDRETRGQGLVQTLTIEPAQPRTGETVRIESVVTNRGSRPIHGTFLDCSLGFSGEIALSYPPNTVKCLSYSFERTLAPGESVTGAELLVVGSSPGEYGLEVAHLIGSTPARIHVRVVE